MAFDLVGLGEVMLRLAAPPPERLEQAGALDVQIGGSEANVAAACARLGLRTARHLGPARRARLGRSRGPRAVGGHGVDCRRRSAAAPGPASASTSSSTGRPRGRCGCSTTGAIPPSAGSRRTISTGRPSRARGSARLGHHAGAGENLRDVIRRAVRRPSAAGVPVSFDVNYRSRLWSPEGGAGLLRRRAAGGALPLRGRDDARRFRARRRARGVLDGLARLAPAATIALTLGEAGSAVLADGAASAARRGSTPSVVDRVGAGDAYAAGFLWAVLTGRRPQEAVDAGDRARRPQVHDLGRHRAGQPRRAGGAARLRPHGHPPLARPGCPPLGVDAGPQGRTTRWYRSGSWSATAWCRADPRRARRAPARRRHPRGGPAADHRGRGHGQDHRHHPPHRPPHRHPRARGPPRSSR